jgi:endoglucanase
MRHLLAGAALMCVACSAGAAPAPQPKEAERPVRLNQLGLVPGLPKRAMLGDSSAEALRWQLVDSKGKVRATGLTEVFGKDAASGENVHQVNFSGFTQPGTYRLRVGGKESRAFAIAGGVYERLPYDALRYFYHNRAGVPIEARFAGGKQWARPAGHAPERATCVSGKDSKGNDWPGCAYTLDVTGGWYDAGDHGKYVVNGGISVWTLLNAYERLGERFAADGKARIPESGNRVNDLLDEARFEMEFLLKMQVPDGTRLKVPVGVKRTQAGMAFTEIDAGGMAHHKVASEKWTPLPTAPHEDRLKRILFPPATGATLNLAAAAAQCARIWREIDPAFAARCRNAAERAWRAAVRNPEVWAIADFTGSGGYGDGALADEFYWAAAELYATTGAEDYAAAVKASPHFRDAAAPEISWNAVAALGTITLAALPNGLPKADVARLKGVVVAAADGALRDGRKVGYAVPYDPPAWPWGSTSSVMNRAMVLALAHDFTGEAKYRDGVVDAMDFILGRNPLDRSFVSGFGARPMLNPHHRFWARQAGAAYPPPPPGALSGGPNVGMSDPVAAPFKGTCAPQKCWIDDVGAFSLNEVAINWNAPLVWVSAWMRERD